LSEGWVKKRYQKEFKIKRMYNCVTKELKNIPIEQVNDYLLNGWVNGTGYSANKNTIYITKDNKNKRIQCEELDEYLTNGWNKGMYNSRYK
jgi:hypothetical protein